MAEEIGTEGQETVDESMMSARDLIAQEIEKTSDAVQAEEAGKEGATDVGTKEEKGEKAPEGAAAEKPDGEKADPDGETPSRTFQIFTDDKESEDYTALDKLTIKFKANQQEHSLSVEELVREAQKKEGLAKTLGTRTKQRDDTHHQLQEAKEQIDKLGGNEDLLLKVLQDENAYKELRTKYLEAGGSTSAVTPDTAESKGAAPDGKDEKGAPSAEEQLMKTGRGIVEDHILPFSMKLAELYGADPQEIAQEIVGLAGEHPQEFFTEEVLDEIINVQIPEALVNAGFKLAEGKTAPIFDASIAYSDNGITGYGIQKKGAAPRGQTEKETELENRIKDLEAKLEGKGSSTDTSEQEKALASVSGGPSDSSSTQLESESGELNLEGADSAADIMKRLQTFGD